MKQWAVFLLWIAGVVLSVGGIAYISVMITFMAYDIHTLVSLFKPPL